MKYKASLYICPANFPFIFARHPWFVVDVDGKISRYEVLFRKDEHGHHLRKDFLPPFKGIGILPYNNKFLWKAQLIVSIEGNEGSLASRIVEFITQSDLNYPNRDRYSLFGSNSNTYAQWVLKHFPEWKVKLPWNAFGKNYHV